MDVAVGSELGIWQRQNDDAHLSESVAPNVTFFGVADGFGALGRGVPTASMALGALRDYVKRRQRLGAFGSRSISPSGVRALLLSALDYANARLYAHSGSHEDFVAGGTSLTAVLIVGHHAFIGHVGDARAYLLRFGRLEMLTVDDAMFTDAVASAKSSLPARPRARSLLWRSLGTQPKLEASIAHVELLAGDQLLLCTDGIHRCISVDEIGEALGEATSSSDVVARLLGLSRTRGNLDNATVIVGRDLLFSSLVAPSGATAPALSFRYVAAMVMLICAAICLGFFVYRAATFDPTATETYATDHR
ncbi:MAG: serine/threonine-protein phosphatase [Candidatus Eremiobacteraeota bacterium]|nr:serine/threonine-protein phosphatase [Candidatus Eremiobacteraeota bacterium]